MPGLLKADFLHSRDWCGSPCTGELATGHSGLTGVHQAGSLGTCALLNPRGLDLCGSSCCRWSSRLTRCPGPQAGRRPRRGSSIHTLGDLLKDLNQRVFQKIRASPPRSSASSACRDISVTGRARHQCLVWRLPGHDLLQGFPWISCSDLPWPVPPLYPSSPPHFLMS